MSTYTPTINSDPTKAALGQSDATGSNAIAQLQTSLNAKGAKLVVDGKYGPLTQAAATQYSNVSTPVGTISNPSAISTSNAGASNFQTQTTNLTNSTTAPVTQPGQPKQVVTRNQNADGTYAVTYSDGSKGVEGLPTLAPSVDATKIDVDKQAAIDSENADKADALQRNQTILDAANKLYDDQASAAAASITANYTNLYNAKNKILQQQIDRSQAYGLAQGGRTVPIQFNNAIDNEQIDRQNQLTDLITQRDAAIAAAKAAANSGKVTALTAANNKIDEITKNVKDQLTKIEQDSRDKYTQLLKVKAEQDSERQVAVQKAAAAAALSLGDSYKNATTDEERNKIILDYMQENALGNMQNSQDAFNEISKQVGAKALELKAADQKKITDALDIKAKNASIAASSASTANTKQTTDINKKKLPYEIKKLKADAAKTQAEADASDDGSDSTDTSTVIAPDGTEVQITD